MTGGVVLSVRLAVLKLADLCNLIPSSQMLGGSVTHGWNLVKLPDGRLVIGKPNLQPQAEPWEGRRRPG